MNELLKINITKIAGTHKQNITSFPVTGAKKIFKLTLVIKNDDLIIPKRLCNEIWIQHLQLFVSDCFRIIKYNLYISPIHSIPVFL